MDERDKEIRQIELALGQYLVPSTDYPLVNYLKGDTNYNLLLVPSGGNVGIGTTTPTAKLDVKGTVIFDNSQPINDADVGEGKVAMWLDSANSKVFFKAKIGGVIKTGSVSLTST